MMTADSYHLSNVAIKRVTEQFFSMQLVKLLPEGQNNLSPVGVEVDAQVEMSVNSWFIDGPEGRVLIDTAMGDGKDRSFSPLFNQRNSPWMDNLKRTVIGPDDIDYVLHPHLHTDLVGRNTVWNGKQWVPAFIHATWVCPQVVLDFVMSQQSIAREVVFGDSIAPIIECGPVVTLPNTATIFFLGITFYPTPGHSIGHMSIVLESEAETSIFCGDIMHTPLQVEHNTLSSVFGRDCVLAN